MKRSFFIRSRYFAAITLAMAFVSGCLPKRKCFIEKKLFIPQTKCANIPRSNDCIEVDQRVMPAAETEIKQPMVTVWVHGTKETMRILRKIKSIERFFYTHKGLFPLEALEYCMHHRVIGEVLLASDQEQFPRGHMYMFGWSGKMTFEAREQAARELHTELIDLLGCYEKNYGYRPKIRMITHSHGGNVALNLAVVKNEFKTSVDIEELILLACPVQDQTEPFVGDSIFKHVYSLYSNRDFFQVLDAQGGYETQRNKAKTYFSRRRFQEFDNLTQVKIKINRRPISHIEFILRRFLHMLPCVMTEIDSWPLSVRHACGTELVLALYTHNYKHPARLKS
jgi:hypothetical protein